MSIPKYFKFPMQFDAALLKRDLAAIQSAEWTPHFNQQYYEGDWSGVSLRSVGGKSDSIYPNPVAEEPYLDTAMLRKAPYVRDVLDEIKCEKESVRFLRLAAGAKIKEHKDYFIGIEDGTVRLHIPVITNPLIEFYLDGERVGMKEGELWYLDFGLKHRVENNSDQDRIHLVMDCTVNDWLLGHINKKEAS
jgi:quercetin dioxygenase-like cupin family protein